MRSVAKAVEHWLTRITLVDGEDVDLWSARDALVLKAITIVLAKHLPISTRCTHVKGHGGAKAAARQVMAHLPTNSFVLRTDVKAYYAFADAAVDALGPAGRSQQAPTKPPIVSRVPGSLDR